MDIIQEGMRIPKIEYDIYLYIPIKNICNMNLLNKSSDYYNDICSTAKSESGTDIIHEDRQKEYINKTVCQDYCEFADYNNISQKAICSCKITKSSSSFINMNINTSELLKNFKHIKNVANLNLLGCTKNLFSKTGIIKNFASYIMIIIILIHIIVLFIFFVKQFKNLKKKIKNIIYAVKNISLINNKVKDEEIKKEKINKGRLN